MKKLLASMLVVACASTGAHAAGDAAQGKTKAAACGACHGMDGNSMVPNFPKLAGQGERYLIKQMQDIKSGERPIVEMTGQLDNMSDQDLADIAAFFASQKTTLGAAKADLMELGERVYRVGSKEKGVAACTSCHSPTGAGNSLAGFPALSGQHAAYIAKQLKDFRTGAEMPGKGRVNDGETRIMRDIAIRLTDLEIEAVSSYISGLH